MDGQQVPLHEQDIADPVLRLLSDEARYVTGHALPVDGGVCSQ
jgi:NAD(P)-dependent dehydrogenase (short-subunit alcohol dehydrogenase family)